MTRRVIAVLCTAAAITALGAPPAAAAPARIRTCARGFLTVPPVAPARIAHPPKRLALPPGLRVGRGLAAWAMASDATRHRARHVGYEVVAAPTGFACSGLGYFEDDVSYATFWSKRSPSHAVTARFHMGQGGFAALCAYLAAAGRRAAARSVARTFGTTLRQCRMQTPDLPLAARAHGVRLRRSAAAPFAVVVTAPARSEVTWSHLSATGRAIRGRRTTTPTLSVSLTRFTGLGHFVSPQSYDCSLPSTGRALCLRGIRGFVAETLITGYGWRRGAAARAAGTVVNAFR